jgi:glycosyltransferase involved in cell wall biosynthesis
MEKITAIINTYNELPVLKNCLESLKGHVDEIIVTDMKSTDGSKELAESFGCKVIEIEPAPVVEETIVQKVVLARNKWILALDPDMRVPDATWGKLYSIIESDKYDVVVFSLRNKFLGHWLKYGHASQCVSNRLFRKDYFLRNVFPKVEIYGLLINTFDDGNKYFMPRQFYIEHYAYSDINRVLEQHLRYAEYEAKELLEKGMTSAIWLAFYRGIRKFLGDMIIRKGILDGRSGIIYSATVAMMILQREFIIISNERHKKS